MAADNKITYLANHEIDKAKWDNCVENAANGLIYARSFYLDCLSDWDGLVLNDYEAVMPLCWKRKWGVHYLYTPYFIQSLGVFGNSLSPGEILHFLWAIPKRFRYWDIKMNDPGSAIPANANLHLATTFRANYLLNLRQPYQGIKSGYKRLGARMIDKAGKQQVEIIRNGLPEQVITFYQNLYGAKHDKISTRNYNMLIKAATACLDKGMARVYLSVLPGGEMTAAYLVLVDNHFVYSLIGGSSETGKRNGSFYMLTDAAISDHAGSGRVFRFEGSDIPGVAFFNRQFGAEPAQYVQLVRNNLPLPLKWLK